jgi:hypothetical protein
MDSKQTLTCAQSNDVDRSVSSTSTTYPTDTVTHTWSGGGTFENNINVGTSVNYIVGSGGSDTVTCTADDGRMAGDVRHDASVSANRNATVATLEVYSVGFTGDNPLERTPTSGSVWGDATGSIVDPIWVVTDTATEQGRKNHVCYNMGATPTAKVKYRSSKELTKAATFKAWPYSSGWSKADLTIAAGARISSEGSCTRETALVSKVYNGTVSPAWKYKNENGANVERDVGSTSHKAYLTYGTPTGSDVTVKRIDAVTSAANGESDLQTCAEKVFATLTATYDLTAANWGPNPVWLVREGGAGNGAACAGLAKLVKVHFQMLGLGSGSFAYCYATAAGWYDKSATPLSLPTRPSLSGHAATTTHFDNNSKEYLDMVDGNGKSNNYECGLDFNGWIWCCGEGKWQTAKEVVNACFGGRINWTYSDGTDWQKCTEKPWVEVAP